MTTPEPSVVADLPASSWTAGVVLQVFRQQGVLTRAELMQRTGLARSTIGLRLDELRAAGLVGGESAAPSTGGRPPVELALAAESWLVAGADLGARHVTVAIADLNGSILSTATRSTPAAPGPEPSLTTVVEMIDGLLQQAGRSRADVLAMGMGLPGSVEQATGRTRRPVLTADWDGFAVRGWLEERTGVPVQIDNDVNVMALGEGTGVWPEVDDLVFVKASTGIGGGIISGGQLQRGAFGGAGDLGHIEVPGKEHVVCECGSRGCLEAVAGVPALLAQLHGRAGKPEDLADLVRRNDGEAVALVRDAGRSLGAVLAAVVSLLNPAVVVLGGRLADAGEPFIAGVREVVYRRGMPLATNGLRIVESDLRSMAGVTGALRMALDEALHPAAVDRLIASGRTPGTVVAATG